MLAPNRTRRLCAVALVALLPIQLIGLAQDRPAPDEPEAATVTARQPAPAPARVPSAPRPDAGPAPVATPALAVPAPAGALVTEPDVVPASASAAAAPAPAPARTSRATTLGDRYPAQAAAVQDPRQPATTRWALLIGINEHMGRVNDNIGSRQDAEDLRTHLLANGWRDDHILLITDRDATRTNILAGIAWLAEKTDRDSVAIFHYSGHSKKWYGQDHDGDGEITDEGLWPTDDRFIPDSELVAALAPVDPFALWANFATCNSAGFADPGLARPGRLLTFSSGEPQKSYEHPSWGNSVWGWFLVEQAMMGGRGDADGDGRVTVEEAYTWARPQASATTRSQSHGAQDAVIVDLVDGDFDVVIPGTSPSRPAAAPSQPSEPSEPAPAPAPAPAPPGDDEPEPEPDDGGNGLCLLCGR